MALTSRKIVQNITQEALLQNVTHSSQNIKVFRLSLVPTSGGLIDHNIDCFYLKRWLWVAWGGRGRGVKGQWLFVSSTSSASLTRHKQVKLARLSELIAILMPPMDSSVTGRNNLIHWWKFLSSQCWIENFILDGLRKSNADYSIRCTFSISNAFDRFLLPLLCET